VYVAAGKNSLIVWVLSTLLCLPMLLMFDDMVRENPDGRGIESFIRRGLGDVFARCVPFMFIALVCVGLPSGAFVAGRYVARALGEGSATTIIIAAAILLFAGATTVSGVRASTRLQNVVTWGLIAMALILLTSALPAARSGSDVLLPSTHGLGAVLPAVVLAFWAFAGFENLTFLSREFRHPERDFLPVSAIALAVYGAFTILLTLAIAVRIPRAQVDQVVGLLQLAETITPRTPVIWAVTVIACAAMLLNAVSWIWGMSELARDAAERHYFPVWLEKATAQGVPRRAIGVLLCLFTITGLVLVINSALVIDALAAASTIFMILYIMSIISYFVVRGITFRSMLNLGPLVLMAVSLFQSGWRSLYGVAILAVALIVNLARRQAFIADVEATVPERKETTA
jgi:amino acid efflux transporter